ncbi:MAG: radical SAM protein [Candidatus Bathyarchaeota archaeon]|nr:MAG: radical SAM protein [Candidatus Bathyarchaeota archaeon]
MIIKEVYAKTILSKSKVADYTVNPYVGCEHGCTYCYAHFMKRFTGHREPWSTFVDVKINAATLLNREVRRKKLGRVWVSGVCDPYQPVEKKYEITRMCLQVLLKQGWPVTVQTKSPLVLRDLDLLRQFREIEVGLTVTTANENFRRIFEPNSPTIRERIETLERLNSAGVETFAMIAPLLPGAEKLVPILCNKVDHVLIDKMNYHYADWVYKKYGLEYALTDTFFKEKKKEFATAFEGCNVPCQILF